MRWISKFFHAFAMPFEWVHDILANPAADRFIDNVQKLVPQVMQYVAIVTAATGSPKDDEFVAKLEAFYEKYSMKVDALQAVPPEDRWTLALNAAVKLAQKNLPGINLTLLISAIQLAYGTYKGAGKPVVPVAEPVAVDPPTAVS